MEIPISWVELDGVQSFPVLSVKDTVNYLVQSKNLSKLMGDTSLENMQSTLLEFWRRYQLEFANYQVYDAASQGKLSLSRTIPVYLHGDEGRGYKKSPVMIVALQGCIGRGSRPFKRRHPIQSLRNLKMGVNLQGSSFNSRFLYMAMPKKFYNVQPDSWRKTC